MVVYLYQEGHQIIMKNTISYPPTKTNQTYTVFILMLLIMKTKGKLVNSSTFRRIWRDQCPYPLFMKPATDLCFL